MRTPTDILRDEHRVILRALDLLESAAARVAAGGTLPDGWWQALIAWLRAFADRNHHAKEERALFPAMVKGGVPSEGPVAVMLEEHETGRTLIGDMERAELVRRPACARAYVSLLRAHIDKENGIVFPLADAVLDEPAQQALAREFEAVEAEQGRDASVDYAAGAVEGLAAMLG